jgi:putative membrane protein
MPEAEGPSIRDHYAAERTLLAWVRTGIAMMGFGFLVARFAVADAQAMAAWFGAGMVFVGAIANALALADYRREVRRLGAGGVARGPSRTATATAAFLVLTGILMAAYLVVLRP